jgi:hypothetical protein
MTLGIAAGTVAWAALARRLGLRFTGITAICGLAVFIVARAQIVGTAMSAASFLMGLFLAGWFVTNTPTVAAFSFGTTAFSLNISLSIAVGAVGGVIGGRLPGWLLAASPAMTAAGAKRTALMLAAIPLLAAAALIATIRFPDAPPKSGSGLRAARAFLVRFLPAVLLWYAFGAGFIPFFNAYLRNRMGASVAAIGGIFAAVHLAHAGGTLLMPLLVARVGLVRAVLLTQVLAAAGVLAMWPVDTLRVAAVLYMVYGSFQVMSEPGLHNLLMSGVPAEERPAAMAANLLLMFAVQAVVGAMAGKLIVERGYGALFVALSVTGLAAAALFAALFRRNVSGTFTPES